jgi:hypothetical protein
MYLHAGNNFIVNTDEIIGIFDMDNTTVSRLGKGFLARAQSDGEIINAAETLPKSYIVSNRNGRTKVFISSISSRVLATRAKTAKNMIQDVI